MTNIPHHNMPEDRLQSYMEYRRERFNAERLECDAAIKEGRMTPLMAAQVLQRNLYKLYSMSDESNPESVRAIMALENLCATAVSYLIEVHESD